jgi:hypothetical protein
VFKTKPFFKELHSSQWNITLWDQCTSSGLSSWIDKLMPPTQWAVKSVYFCVFKFETILFAQDRDPCCACVLTSAVTSLFRLIYLIILSTDVHESQYFLLTDALCGLSQLQGSCWYCVSKQELPRMRFYRSQNRGFDVICFLRPQVEAKWFSLIYKNIGLPLPVAVAEWSKAVFLNRRAAAQ